MAFITKSYQNLFGVRSYINAMTDAVQHKPCCLLGNMNITRQLAATNAFLVRKEQKNSIEPLL